MAQKQNPPGSGKIPIETPEMTRLESAEEIQEAIQARRARMTAPPKRPAPGPHAKAPAAEPAEIEALAERPVQRPPVGLLCILDDGKADGEWVRLRADRVVIGRAEGDILIPHDGLISGRHAELIRRSTPNGYRWFLVDLESKNGTFVRTAKILLRHDNEFLIGGGCYRFKGGAAAGPATPSAEAGAAAQSTQAWTSPSMRMLVPSLVEMAAAGPVQRFPLTLAEYWIGRDPQSCPIARPDDFLVNARHARLYRDAKGQWHIENNKSLNGLWLRITEPMPLGGVCQFRLGEQRFIFQVK